MSFLQFGAAVTAILGPVVAAWVVSGTGYYSPMQWAYCGLIAIGAVLMFVIPSTTQTFFSEDPSNRFQPRDDGEGAKEAISLPPSTPIQNRRMPSV